MSILPARNIQQPGVQRNFNALEKDLESLQRGVQGDRDALTRRLASGFANRDAFAQPTVRTRAFQRVISSAENATVVIWIPEFAEKLGAVKARSKAGEKIDTGSSTFSTLSSQSGPPPEPADDDWTDNYYIINLILPIGNKKLLSYIEILVTNNSGQTVHNETFEFDSDTNPGIKWLTLNQGAYDAANDKWPYTASYQADEDALSIKWAIHSVGTPINSTLDASYTSGGTFLFGGCVNGQANDAATLASLTPDTLYIFIARAYTGASCAGDTSPEVEDHVNQEFKTPKLGLGVIPIEWLYASFFQANFSGQFDWDATNPYKRISYTAGTLKYASAPADTGSYNQSYSIRAGGIDLITGQAFGGPTTDFWDPDLVTTDGEFQTVYVYFDPDVDVDDFQWTKTFNDVFPSSTNPLRVYIGLARAAGTETDNFRAFFLANGSTEPLISAVFANFGSLQALFAKITVLDVVDTLVIKSGGVFEMQSGAIMHNTATDYKITDAGFWVKQYSTHPIGDPSIDVNVYSLGDDASIYTASSVTNAFLNEVVIQARDKGSGQVGKITIQAIGTGSLISLGADSVTIGNIITASDIKIDADNKKLILGDGQDASVYWDGSDMVIDPGIGEILVPTGILKLQEDLWIDQDDKSIYFGEGQDADIFWNNANLELVIDPDSNASTGMTTSVRIVGRLDLEYEDSPGRPITGYGRYGVDAANEEPYMVPDGAAATRSMVSRTGAAVAVGTFTPSHKIPVIIAGVAYHIQLDAV